MGLKFRKRILMIALLSVVLLLFQDVVVMWVNVYLAGNRRPSLAQNKQLRTTNHSGNETENISTGQRGKRVNCELVIRGTHKLEIYKALRASKKIRTSIESNDYIRMTSDCPKFISDRKYIVVSLTEEEEAFPIGFAILVYKDIEQFERLLRAIYRPQNYYCVHVDGNCGDALYNAVRSIASCFNNVFLTPTRVPVTWGTMSVLDANLLCMKTLYERSTLWKYFINLTGQEFPLKTNYELVKILKAYNGSNDMYGARRQFQKRWKNCGTAPHGIPTKGSLLIAACRGFVEFAISDYRAQDFLKWIEKTFIPDETFFASLNFNAHLNAPGSPRETVLPTEHFLAHFINWGDFTCGGKIVRDLCVFGIKDLPLLSTRKELFANKFFWDYQRLGYECLEELLYNRTMHVYNDTHQYNTSYYRTRRFVLDKQD